MRLLLIFVLGAESGQELLKRPLTQLLMIVLEVVLDVFAIHIWLLMAKGLFRLVDD